MLTQKAKSIVNYKHRILYYGPTSVTDLKKTLSKYHKVPKKFATAPTKKLYPELELDKDIVYFVNYDMVQAELLMLSKKGKYSEETAIQATLFNEYFGGSMGSIVFQELRESKALAYAVRSSFSTAGKPEKSNYIVSYIGSQADKLNDAVNGMIDLHNNFQSSELAFQNAKEAVKSSIETQRTTKSSVLFAYESAQEFGRDYSLRSKVYDYTNQATLKDVEEFHQNNFKNQKRVYLIIGSKEHVDLEKLKALGEVKELALDQIFGY